MRYRVVLKQCTETRQAAVTANEVSEWSGTTARAVLSALEYKDICLRKDASETEAHELKNRFEKVGAEIVLEPIGSRLADEDEKELDKEDEKELVISDKYDKNPGINRVIRATSSYRLGVRAFHGMSSTAITSFISFVLCFIILIYVLSASNKLAERSYRTVKLMESKTIKVPVMVHDTIADCDTVFIIDGHRFKKAD